MATRRRRRKFGDDIGVEMSPLIDCVFLLLIFFLVTSMMKKLEKQIPVVMPDSNVALAQNAVRDVIVLGIHRDERYLFANTRTGHGSYVFAPLSDLDAYISYLVEKEGLAANIRIYADEEVPFQKVIDLLDKLKNIGFENVDVRMLDSSVTPVSNQEQPK